MRISRILMGLNPFLTNLQIFLSDGINEISLPGAGGYGPFTKKYELSLGE